MCVEGGGGQDEEEAGWLEGDYGSSPIASKAIGEGRVVFFIITCLNVSIRRIRGGRGGGGVAGYLAR